MAYWKWYQNMRLLSLVAESYGCQRQLHWLLMLLYRRPTHISIDPTCFLHYLKDLFSSSVPLWKQNLWSNMLKSVWESVWLRCWCRVEYDATQYDINTTTVLRNAPQLITNYTASLPVRRQYYFQASISLCNKLKEDSIRTLPKTT